MTALVLAHKKYNTASMWDDYLAICCIRSRCKDLRKECYSNYVRNLENSLPYGMKDFWTYVNDVRKKGEYPVSIYLDDVRSSESKSIVSLFANRFKYVYMIPNVNEPFNTGHHSRRVFVSLEDILKSIAKLDVTEFLEN